MLYTRKGDNGTSGLFGTRERFPKDSPVYEALGSLDELNSFLGFCHARARKEDERRIPAEIRAVQEALFIIQAEIAGAPMKIDRSHIDALEKAIDAIEKTFENPHRFVLPGSTELSALLDCARAVARRTERAVVRAGTGHSSHESRAYLNRLSSLLYALARHVASREKTSEASPSYTITNATL